MTYTADSPIRGTGTVSAEAINAWFRSEGPEYAPQYAPDRTYKPAPPTIGNDIVAVCREWGINHDLMAAQILHESAAWQSRIVRDKNNPSGLGAVNNNAYAGAVTFSTPFEGIRATAAHLMVYAVGEGPWAQYDPRYAAVKANGWLGTAPTLRGLNGKWASPGTTYGQGIATLANDLTDFANNGTWEPPMALTPPAGWTPPEIVRRILPRNASNTPQRRMDWQYITVHNTGNPNPTANALMHANWLESLAKSGASEPSWQYTVDDTRVVQHLEDDQAGWHASDDDGPGNLASLGFELVEIGDQERVLWNAGYVIAQKLRSKGKDTSAIRQHHDWARDKKNCPRLLRANNGAGWKRLLAIVDHFLKDAPSPPPADDWPTVPPAVPDPRRDNPFGAFWIPKAFVTPMAVTPLSVSGYVISPAHAWTNPDGEVLIVQFTERQRYELHKSGEVTLGRLGAEAMERKP